MKQYRSKGSGILYDALAAGVPLIAPSDTALGRWIVKSNSGVLFYEQNTKSIMKAIEQLSHNYLFYKKNALAFKKFWQQEHGISQFISKLLINR
jgi:glycosyltransferase involved in cell wall biosynthesis